MSAGRCRRSVCTLWLALAAAMAAATAAAQDVNAQHGVINFLEPVLADPILQHSKEIYVLYGCAYCHGVDLRVRNGEATDLLHSPLVGLDRNGNLIAPLLRAGIPQTPKLSPMPQFSDLSNGEIVAIVRWIHYARQQGRYRELARAELTHGGDVVAGRRYFARECAACHALGTDMAKIGSRYSRRQLAERILRPAFLDAKRSAPEGSAAAMSDDAARTRHLALLENYTAEDLNDLVAFLQTMR